VVVIVWTTNSNDAKVDWSTPSIRAISTL